ncbi:MAG TPA: hypothetical protein VJQ56_00330, partial [Blastocatellia bacterium]|nr:hypothetical protein [Blastocatellia bacterium]
MLPLNLRIRVGAIGFEYGMIYNVSSRRQMSIDANGVISDGVQSASVEFNYPVSGSTTVSGAPTFSQRTETAANAPAGTFSYATATNATTQTKAFSVNRPDGSTLHLTRSTNASLAANGRLVQSEIKNGAASFARSVFTYANDPDGSPQVQSFTAYNDAGVPTRSDFDYDQYGNVLNQREYGFQTGGTWQVRRRTRYTYKTDQPYIDAFLRSLVTQVEVLDALENTNDADDLVMARSSFAYDNYAAMGGMEQYWSPNTPPGHLTSYNASHTVRGNVTGTTVWTDIGANASITRLAKYDKFGNVIRSQVSCCNEKNFTFNSSTYWARPVEVINGSPSGVHLKSTIAYDFGTLVVKSETDPNNLTTSYTYDDVLRITKITAPTGATANTAYNDGALSVSTSASFVEPSPAGNINMTATGSVVFDGWGQVIQSVNNYDGQVNTTYDALGRVASRTNPFPVGGQPGPTTTYQYDTVGRLKQTTLPDNSVLTSTFSGAQVRSTSQINRKGMRESDGLGRLIKVTEQDGAGALNQDTIYTYDALDRLVSINQGGQTRAFKYDALSRLLFERNPEQAATISDGSGGLWSAKYTYTDFNAVSTRTDARGVVTTYGYDALHRLTSVSYDTSNAPGVATTLNLTYSYDTTQTSGTKGLLLGLTAGTHYQETFSYDQFNRVSQLARRIDTANYTTSYTYNMAGEINRITYPSGRIIYTNRDTRGRFHSVTSDLYVPYVSALSYNAAGQVTGRQFGASPVATETFSYDSNTLQMTGQTATRNGTTLLSLSYGYQAQAGQNGTGTTASNAGKVMSVSGQIGGLTESASFTYDLLGRLLTANQTTNGASAQ